MASLDLDPTTSIYLAHAVTGVLLHQLFFRRVEVDTHAFAILVSLFAASASLFSYLVFVTQAAAFAAAWTSFVATSCLVAAMCASMLVYRVLFHPLRRFPGPVGAKATRWWTMGKVIQSNVRYWKVLGEMRDRYGDYVRTGPREITIFDATALPSILPLPKGPWYDMMETSMHTTRDTAFHRKRRRVWDQAFKTTSLVAFAPRVEALTDALMARIAGQHLAAPVSANTLFTHYSYDVMSVLAFGQRAGFIDGSASAAARSVLHHIESSLVAIGVLSPVPWLLGLVTTLFPFLLAPLLEYNRWSEAQVDARMKALEASKPFKDMSASSPSPADTNPPDDDLFSHLLASTPSTPSGRALLNAESRLVIGAGSGTTSVALTVMLVYLVRRPAAATALRAAVDEAFSAGDFVCTKPLPALDAFILEALRLHPPVLFASQRVTGAAGLRLATSASADGKEKGAEVYIPPDTLVAVSAYHIARDERNFLRANEFLPERWTTRPELIVNRAAAMPFGAGPYNCVGRALAMMELRSVLARLVRSYDVDFPEGEGEEFDEEAYFDQTKEQFTAGVGELRVVLRERRREGEGEGEGV